MKWKLDGMPGFYELDWDGTFKVKLVKPYAGKRWTWSCRHLSIRNQPLDGTIGRDLREVGPMALSKLREAMQDKAGQLLRLADDVTDALADI